MPDYPEAVEVGKDMDMTGDSSTDELADKVEGVRVTDGGRTPNKQIASEGPGGPQDAPREVQEAPHETPRRPTWPHFFRQTSAKRAEEDAIIYIYIYIYMDAASRSFE
ncbi:unnamed protein product [Prorocentrum cordatum]|uniref:Uncharacterized protein n=1 Tax=Prorocentrum cordatum TaxID=2364126 RepID=A0ABN9W2F8_9DINO|nr:unnamed protein product [Polarella glacialis]